MMMDATTECAGHGSCGQSATAPFNPVVNGQLVQLDEIIDRLESLRLTLKPYGAAWYAAGRAHRELARCRRYTAGGE